MRRAAASASPSASSARPALRGRRAARAIAGHPLALVGDGRRVAVRLHQQHRVAVGRQADVGVVLDAAGRHPIEELERARDDPRRDDRGDRFRRILDPIVERQHRPPRRRARHQLQQHLGDDAERAFRSDEQVLHRVAGDVLHARAAEPRDPAVGQHDFERHHVVARDAVLQAAQPAGVLRDVAADGADAHRPGIGRIEQPMSRGRLVDRDRRDAWLCAEREVPRIHVEDRVHLREAHHHRALTRHAAAAQSRARPAGDDRNRFARRELHAARDVRRCCAGRRPPRAAA